MMLMMVVIMVVMMMVVVDIRYIHNIQLHTDIHTPITHVCTFCMMRTHTHSHAHLLTVVHLLYHMVYTTHGYVSTFGLLSLLSDITMFCLIVLVLKHHKVWGADGKLF